MKLLEPISLNGLPLSNRMAMAPMTRSRASQSGIVGELTATYYRQRAGAGLIVTEGVNISPDALGSPWTPGIWNEAQVEAWAKVVQAVHAEGGKIYAQLWHTGRVGHSVDRDGQLPVAPSAIAIEGQQHFTSQGPKAYEVPRALSTEEVIATVEDYRKAAQNALAAGFDGVELHAAFGYLPNQFLVDGANQRSDQYGGSIENRSRFVLEVMQALRDVYTNGQVGIKLSPSVYYNSIVDSDPTALFTYLVQQLDRMQLAYIHMMRAFMPLDAFPHWPADTIGTFAPHFKGMLIANGGFDRDSAEAELARGLAGMVSFGTHFLANPDLPARFAANAPLNAADRSTFFGGGEKGYTDYPFLNATHA